jgi:hypothetical protein
MREFQEDIITRPDEEKEIDDAIMIVSEIRQQVAVMGANDYEIPAIDRIIEALKLREITPKEAISEANIILGRKNDYH